MIDLLVHHQALIRELINGVAFVLLFTLTIMIAVFLWDTWARVRPVTISEWQSLEGVPTACVLWWIFGAEAYRTLNVWYAYNLSKDVGVGIFSASNINSTVGYLVAGIILNLALLAAIYRFTPPDWQRRVWIYATGAAALFVCSPTIIDYFT